MYLKSIPRIQSWKRQFQMLFDFIVFQYLTWRIEGIVKKIILPDIAILLFNSVLQKKFIIMGKL